ncbi:MAG: hypothetical protein AAGG01_01100, partial [Planctomycetota bacterium]
SGTIFDCCSGCETRWESQKVAGDLVDRTAGAPPTMRRMTLAFTSMLKTTLPTALFTSLFLCACGSSGGGDSRAQAPIVPAESVEATTWNDESGADAPAEPWAPAPWTGAFGDTAVMLANAFHIEGPVGLLEHVVASSDDAYYDRSVQTTDKGLMQVIQRTSPDVPEIRVQLDAWTLAAFDRVVILERIDESPVRVIASGDALWRDSDGRIASSERIECTGAIGQENHAIPEGAVEVGQTGPSDSAVDAEASTEPAAEVPAEAPAALPSENPVEPPADTPADVTTTASQDASADAGAQGGDDQ